jgi:hypothetical protein
MQDKFRKVYKKLHEENSKLITEMKEIAEKLDSNFDYVKSREMSLAVTNLEQAMMWATKAIVLEDEKNGGIPVRFPK